jgi:uncharacterized membrane protein (DUF485 family)
MERRLPVLLTVVFFWEGFSFLPLSSFFVVFLAVVVVVARDEEGDRV